jgi:hypothetical protein
MKNKQKVNQRKRIVYLFGAGATHGEIKLHDETINILMPNIREGMLEKIDKRKIKNLSEVKNELSNEKTDVEHLITLYESTGIRKHDIIAKKLKQLFREEIQEKIMKLGDNFVPKLLSALIDMHEIAGLDEKLIGILTLNYEDLVEKAVQEVKGEIDYSIRMKEKHSNLTLGNVSYPILKLHGSFNWKNEFPITLTDDKKIGPDDVLWIPPGVEKKKERYPFSIIWGRAKEILDCDILRIIGCSLSRNDWQLISLLYTTQRLNINKKEYIIELINYSNQGGMIKDNYPYLRFRIISEIKEIREYLIKSYSLKDKEERKSSKALNDLLDSSNQKINIFDTWLKAKGESLKNQSIPITTTIGLFEAYINE